MIRGLLSYGAARVLAGAGMFAAIIVLVRSLDGTAYGIYAQTMVLAQVCGYLCAGWVQLGMVRMVAGTDGEAGRALLVNVRIVLVAALAVSALVAAGMMLTHPMPVPGWAAAVVGGMAMAFGLSEYAMSQANVTGALRQFVWINAIRYLSPLPVLLVLAYLDYLSPLSAALVLAICALISGIAVFGRRSPHDGPLKAAGTTFKTARQLAWLGAPALLVYSLWPVTTLINRSFIFYFGTMSDLGYFAAVSDLMNGPTVLLFQVLIWTWVANITAAVNSGDLAMARTQISEFLGAVLLLALPGGVALWFAAPALYGLLAGELPPLHDSTPNWVALNSIAVCVYVAAAACLIARRKACLAFIGTPLCFAATAVSAWLASGAAEDTARNCALVTIVCAFVLMLCAAKSSNAWLEPRCSMAALTAALAVWLLCASLPAAAGGAALVQLVGSVLLTSAVVIGFDVLGLRKIVKDRVVLSIGALR